MNLMQWFCVCVLLVVLGGYIYWVLGTWMRRRAFRRWKAERGEAFKPRFHIWFPDVWR